MFLRLQWNILCASHHSKRFTCFNSCSHHNSPVNILRSQGTEQLLRHAADERASPALASAPHPKPPTKHTLDDAALDHCSWTFSAYPSLSGMENPQIKPCPLFSDGTWREVGRSVSLDAWYFFFNIINLFRNKSVGKNLFKLRGVGVKFTLAPPRKRKMKVLVTQLCPTLCDPRTVAYQAPLSTGFSRQEYWSG